MVSKFVSMEDAVNLVKDGDTITVKAAFEKAE